MKRLVLGALLLAAPGLMLAALPAGAHSFITTIAEDGEIVQMRPEFKTPSEPNQLFYVQRSPNSNTVIYTARLDGHGEIDRGNPVEGYWRKFNIDGSRQPLNLIERMMAYGVRADRAQPGKPVTFAIAALPEQKFTVTLDTQHRPEALAQIGSHTVKVDYIYLHVKEGGLLPDVPVLDVFGTDIVTGKAVHEHMVKVN